MRLIPIMLAFAPFALVSCDRSTAAVASSTHTVRARVVSMPGASARNKMMTAHHEEIPAWDRGDGTKGMNAMVMPFPLGKGVTLEGITEGDVIEIVVVQYSSGPVPYEATSIRKLPRETKLSFE
jgi:Cu/Ag efflux protein CusF